MERRGSKSFGVAIGVVVGALLTGIAVPYLRVEPSVVAAGRAQTQRDAPGPGGVSAKQAATAGPVATGSPGNAGTGGPGAAGGDGSTDPASGSAGGDIGGPLAASDTGVTAEEIRVGIPIIDAGVASSFGFNFDLGDQRARWQALIEDRNAQGGIHGRRIVADFRTIVAGQDEEHSQAACIGWTRDVGVFSVLEASGITTAGVVCITGEGGTPLIRTDALDEAYYGSGYFFSLHGSDNRVLADHARFLADNGFLDGKTIGVLANEGAERLAIDSTLVPTLERLGHEIAAVEEVPAGAPGAQRSSVAISNFRAAGVDLVILAAGVVTSGPFVQSADRAGYRPTWAMSSFNNQVNDQLGDYYPDSFDGSVGLTTMRFPEYNAGAGAPPGDQACLDRVASADPKAVRVGSAAREVAMRECAVFDAWVGGATAAGPGLTRAGLVAGLESMGQFPMAGMQDGQFGPGRHDAVLFERRVVYRVSCQCWQLDGGLDAPARRME